ncbi:hypothetical protein JHK85_033890 [Glycine max]|nr:hypothetical protein JHK85_033890 [Glycine max]
MAPQVLEMPATINDAQTYGRVGLRRQIKVLVRKGVGSNPTLNNGVKHLEDDAIGSSAELLRFMESNDCMKEVRNGNMCHLLLNLIDP